jgi:hypothetical protein
MNTLKVRLNQSMDKAGLGFTDIEGKQEIRVKNPGKREVITVKETHFVRQKIQSGEIEIVEVVKSAASTKTQETSPSTTSEEKPTAEQLNAAREAVAQAEAALENAKADIKKAEDATQKANCKTAIENAGQALGDARAELKRLEKLAK